MRSISIENAEMLNSATAKGLLKALCYLLDLSANEFGSRNNDAIYQNNAKIKVKMIQEKFDLNKNAKGVPQITGNINRKTYEKIIEEYHRVKELPIDSKFSLSNISTKVTRDFDKMGIIQEFKYGAEDGVRQYVQDWIDTGAAVQSLGDVLFNQEAQNNFMSAAAGILNKYKDEFSSAIKSGDLKKISDVVSNAVKFTNPLYVADNMLLKPLIESYTNTIKEDTKNGAGGIYSATKLVTRLVLDVASFSGIASSAVKIGKETAKVSMDAAKKIASTLGGSLTNVAVNEATYKAMQKIGSNGLNVDNAITSTSRTAVNTTADALRQFMNKLKSVPTSVFDMIKKTSYSDKTETLSVTTLDNSKLLFNKDELIKSLRNQFPQKEAEDIFKMIYTGCFTEKTSVHTKQGLVEIQNIEIGDEVLSKNVETGEISYNKVLEVYKKSTDKIVCIALENETIETTENHLFFTDSGWWKTAGSIIVGEQVLGHNGIYEPVKSIDFKVSETAVAIYNLNVDVNHNYFVGSVGALVHNDCTEGAAKAMREGAGKVSFDALKDADKWLEALTQPELQSLRNYQTGTYKKINQALRDGLPIDGDMLSEIKNIDSAIGKGILTQDEIFYRGFTNKRLIENWESITKGSAFEFVDNGFTSTSKQISVANNFAKDAGKDGIVATIKAKNGTNIANLEALNTPFFDEAEILIERGLNYKVVKAWEENGIKKVILEVE